MLPLLVSPVIVHGLGRITRNGTQSSNVVFGNPGIDIYLLSRRGVYRTYSMFVGIGTQFLLYVHTLWTGTGRSVPKMSCCSSPKMLKVTFGVFSRSSSDRGIAIPREA